MGSVTEGNGLFIVSRQVYEVKRKLNVRLIVGKGGALSPLSEGRKKGWRQHRRSGTEVWPQLHTTCLRKLTNFSRE